MINGDYTNLNSPMRTIKGKVELLSEGGSAAASTNGETIAPVAEYTNQDALKSFVVERTGELGKFFGFGVSQKLETKLLDKNREIVLQKGKMLRAWLGTEEYISSFPIFYVDNTNRDEKTNELTVIAYDRLNAAAAHTVSELSLTAPYTIGEFAEACAELLGVGISDISDASFDTLYEAGANFEGTETIREALNSVAEATQTIYYLDNNEELVFKRLDITGEPALTITNEQYIELQCKPICILSDITHATDLGDNISTTTGNNGLTQYVRNNPFWELRDDIDALLENAISAVGGTSIIPFDCSWRGNFFLEIGDKIGLATKGNEVVNSYFLNDSLTYNGGLSQKTQWSYTESNETATSNPTSLGEALKETFARVNKANKEIALVASESKEAIETLNGELEVVKQQAELIVTPEEVEIAIKKELSNGIDGVYTKKGFSFDDNGMMVQNTDSEGNRISPTATQISENGMKIYDSEDSEVLTANNIGVNAANLHATTYLIIGNNSRLEDFERNGETRTGCFWIGG